VVDSIALDRVAQRPDDVLLADDLVKRLGTVAAIQGGLGHEWASLVAGPSVITSTGVRPAQGQQMRKVHRDADPSDALSRYCTRARGDNRRAERRRGRQTSVKARLTIDKLTAGNASGMVKTKGRRLPGRVKRRCQRKRQVIVFEEAGSQDLRAAQTLTDRRGRWSAQPTQGEYLTLPHHAVVVASVFRDRKSGRRFKCRSGTSTSVTPTPATG